MVSDMCTCLQHRYQYASVHASNAWRECAGSGDQTPAGGECVRLELAWARQIQWLGVRLIWIGGMQISPHEASHTQHLALTKLQPHSVSYGTTYMRYSNPVQLWDRCGVALAHGRSAAVSVSGATCRVVSGPWP